MGGFLPRAFIDEVVARSDIVELIKSRYPSLQAKGNEFTACCPFHNEKTPSFTVSPVKQFYHCFGCGAHGTVIDFLINHDNLEFIEAVEELASRAGLQIPEPEQSSSQQSPKSGQYNRKALLNLLEQVSNFYQKQLRSSPQAIEYLKGRGISGETAKKFKLGFIGSGWNNLSEQFGNGKEQQSLLKRAGLLIEKDDGRSYDRFRERVIFPIINGRGQTIGFGGRDIGSVVSGNKVAKYLNSPETELFHKGKELYGLYQARQRTGTQAQKLEQLIVVEGYMDVVSLAEAGVNNAVATLGTATTKEHINLLFRQVSKVVFCFDGDRAGKDAAWKALNTTLPLLEKGREVRFMFLADGEDPDTIVRKQGAEGFIAIVEQAEALSEFLVKKLKEGIDMSAMDGRARFIELALPLIEKIPAGSLQNMLRQRLESESRMTPESLAVDPQSILSKNRDMPTRARGGVKKPSLVRVIIRLLLDNPQLATRVEITSLDNYLDSIPGVALLRQLLELLSANPDITLATILEHWRETKDGKALANLAVMPISFMLTDKDDNDSADNSEFLIREFDDALIKLAEHGVENRLTELTNKERLTDDDKLEMQELLRQKR